MDKQVERTPQEKTIEALIASIDKDGYAIVPNAFGQAEIDLALERVKHWFEVSLNSQSERMPKLNKDQPMVYNLQAKEMLFCDMVLGNPIIEGVLKNFLNDRWFTSLPDDAPNYILRSFLARSSNHRMPMHIDSFIPYVSEYPFIMQCSILLEDQTRENGCTVVVPGSHLSGKYVDQSAFETALPLEAKAGDMVIWDSRIWHGALENVSGGTRWSMIATFCRWWIKQAFDIPGNLPQEIYDQLDDRTRGVLGYCSVPYDSETFGIDMKRNYELLPKEVADYKH